MATNVVGEKRDTIQRFHNNSQGLDLLDKRIGKEFCSKACLEHPKCGKDFSTYIQWCHQHQVAPRGRVFVALMTVAFRIDRERGRQLNVTHLMKIELKSFSIQDVRDFVARVRLTLTNVEHVHLEQEFMYQWLFETVSYTHLTLPTNREV